MSEPQHPDILIRLMHFCVSPDIFVREEISGGYVRDMLRDARDEIDRLRAAIRRLAEQDATLSVQGGNVIVDITEEKVVRLPSTFTASNVGGWVILALAGSLNAAGVKWEVAEE